MSIKIAARMVSLACIGVAVCNVILATTRGSAIAVYSWTSFAFAMAIFGCLVYGVFKEKRDFILPYLIFQVVAILLTVLSTVVFIVGLAISSKMLPELAEEMAGIDTNISTNPNAISDLQAFTILIVLLQCTTLLMEVWSLDIVYRFREFLKDRENSFTFNLESVFQTPHTIYGASVDELEVVNDLDGFK
ncbi:unnamed protein product [Anisakis simplex]|uniref:Uncharacterized protein n=1 Tax=Anisakis simplex TaxID=6269 RepID=A0A0M3K653_ANISI|nr:unnamed protein product [Anisakis simplex]